VQIGSTPEYRKELVGLTNGARESTHDWREQLLDLKRRELDMRPELAIADDTLGFWKAAGEVWPKRREQCSGVHKTALAMAFKLVEAARQCWRRLDRHNQLLKGTSNNESVGDPLAMDARVSRLPRGFVGSVSAFSAY